MSNHPNPRFASRRRRSVYREVFGPGYQVHSVLPQLTDLTWPAPRRSY